jgi:putative addiction module CopG family antidote
MSTLSVPLPPNLDEFVSDQVKKGLASNKADVVRRALKLLREEEAVMAVLKAEREPTLKGNLEKLAKKIK